MFINYVYVIWKNNKSLFGLGSTAQISITFDDENNKKLVEVKTSKDQKSKLPLFFDGETVSGNVKIFSIKLIYNFYWCLLLINTQYTQFY